MKLYYSPGACSLAPHIVFEWLGQPYELAQADLADPEFLRINPMRAVPALVTELGTLTQCGAVLNYQTTLPGGAVFGPETGNAGQVCEFDRWECFFTGDVHSAFFPFFSPQRYTTDTSEPALNHVRAAAIELVARPFAVLNAHLAMRRYIIDERMSIIDAYATPMLRWAAHAMPELFDRFPHLARHYQTMCEDAGVQAAMRQQGIEP